MFSGNLREYFEEIYVRNTSTIIFNTLFIESKTNFYEKYNSFLIESKVFTDVRSFTIDSIFLLSDSVIDLYEIIEHERVKLITQRIINEFIDSVIDYLLQIRPILLKNLNITTQILIELQVVFLVLNDSMCELNLSKRKNALLILYKVICEIRNVSNLAEEYIDETVVFKDEELQRKKKLISESLDKYSS